MAASNMAGAVLEGVELNSQNVERAVLQFYQSGASQETHKWLTLAQLSTIVRNRLSLNQAESFFLFSSGGVMVTMSSTVQELYAANMDNDGFLYIEYASQETFGASMHSAEGQL